MIFFKKKCGFKEALRVLGQEGFTDNYIRVLREELETAERPKDIARGKSFLANGLLILGKLTEAYSVFEEMDMNRLAPHLRGNLAGNMVFCKYVQNDFKAAEELYQKYNAEILGDTGEIMKRSLAIHMHIKERYEVAVEILVKMLDGECRFLDICIVKAMLRLNMYDRAREFAPSLDRYRDCGELGEETEKLLGKLKSGKIKKKR